MDLGEEACTEMERRALELGISFFDTAMGYGGGTSEEFLGKAVKFTASRKDIGLPANFYYPSSFSVGELHKTAPALPNVATIGKR